MSTLKFQANPPTRAHAATRDRYVEAIAELRAHPGQWAKISTRTTRGSAHTMASNIRTARMAGFRDGNFDAVADDLDVWASYRNGKH